MRKLVNILALLILVGGAAVYFVFGPSVLLGGPSKATIVDVTRKVMETTAASPELAAAAKTAEITPTGLCSNQGGGVYACAVQVSVAGAAPTTFVSEIMKKPSGVWVSK